MTSEGLLGRGVAFCIAALIQILLLSAFLTNVKVGLPLLLHHDAHPAERSTPIIAYIVSPDTSGRAGSSALPTLEANQLAPVVQKLDIPTPKPDWPDEANSSAQLSQPVPSAGRTGLRCEVHIHQSLTGRVQAIDFGECTGDRIWQHTLLQTIERAAQLIDPNPNNAFPPVRTLTVGTDNLSAVILAQQLASTEMFEHQTTTPAEEGAYQR